VVSKTRGEQTEREMDGSREIKYRIYYERTIMLTIMSPVLKETSYTTRCERE